MWYSRHFFVTDLFFLVQIYSLLMSHYFKLQNTDPNFQKPGLFRPSSFHYLES